MFGLVKLIILFLGNIVMKNFFMISTKSDTEPDVWLANESIVLRLGTNWNSVYNGINLIYGTKFCLVNKHKISHLHTLSGAQV